MSERDRSKKRKGISRKRVSKVLSSGGRLNEGELLHCKVRYFLDGLVIGSESFVNETFTLSRDYFGSGRQTGARKLRRVRSNLCSMRDLRTNAIST